jgi:transketolase
MNTQQVADIIRGLSMDGVERAASGHPGAPMGLADVASVLFLKFLKYDPSHPDWPDRDRFVLSAGHASMLLYSLLHLAGYTVSMDDLKHFRQWGSPTPGHPEYGFTPGVETTTGPLGQGCGNSVGMALAEAVMAGRFNKPDLEIVDHYIYTIASDGDLMEGISHEVFSLAGHLQLGRLIVFYDSNRITIEGNTDLAYSDDVRRRMEGCHWHVLEIDGHDHAQIEQALQAAREETDRPTMIIGHTHIGMGSPGKQDTASSHGSPLGEDEVRAAKEKLGLPPDRSFYAPEEVYAMFRERRADGEKAYEEWQARINAYTERYPEDARKWQQHQAKYVPEDLAEKLPQFDPAKPLATRKAGGAILQVLNREIPALIGGSADLGPSNNTLIKDADSICAQSCAGPNIHFGIREHAMGAMLNGLALHGDFIPYGGTFLIFSDYCRPAIRLAALMKQQVVYVFSHDSIFLGEDGPTHQAVEQLASLRAVPNLTVIRPADAGETAQAWLAALARRDGPTALLLTRQSVPVLDRTVCAAAQGLQQGAYTLWQNRDGQPDILLIASGSEVAITLEAGQRLSRETDITVRVISMPSWELFEAQPPEIRQAVLPDTCPVRLAVEAGCTMGWERYTGCKGRTITIDRFGASAPYKVLAEKFGFTANHILDTARDML